MDSVWRELCGAAGSRKIGQRMKFTEIVVEPTENPVCHIVIVSDPDGNSVMIHKRKS